MNVGLIQLSFADDYLIVYIQRRDKERALHGIFMLSFKKKYGLSPGKYRTVGRGNTMVQSTDEIMD